MMDDWTEADEAVEEVREVRRRMWAEFDYDVRKMGAYLRELEKQFADRMIAPPPASKKDRSAA